MADLPTREEDTCTTDWVCVCRESPDCWWFVSVQLSRESSCRRQGVGFRFSGPRRDNINYENTTLELRKIPPEMNTIAKLNEHFSKFGNIVNLQASHV